MSFSSELKNINIALTYYSFIKEIFDDYIKYITNYRLITIEYIKRITQFQEKYSSKLLGKDIDTIKYKQIKTSHIFTITSSIPKIINKQIENLNFFMFGIESQINNYDSLIKEKDILLSKFQANFEESKKDLIKKYREVDKLKDDFVNNLANTEDIVHKYLLKKVKISADQIKKSITLSKKVEKEYKSGINSTKNYEQNFETIYQSSIVNIKKLTSEASSKMKDMIADFTILLKNNSMMLSSVIDVYFSDLNNLNEEKTFEKIIEDSFFSINKTEYIQPYKYQLKIFKNPKKTDDILYTNPILYLEDGFEEMSTIKDETIFSIFKTMKENFDLVEDNNINLKIEEEKMKCLNLIEKILALEENKKNNINKLPTNQDIDELNSLLDKHTNRVVFLQKLSEYRNKGKFELNKKTFEIFNRLFNTIVDTIERDNDFHSAKNAIILSQTYFILDEDKNKKYLQKVIQDNKIFRSKKFWEEFLQYIISKEIMVSLNNDTRSGTYNEENRKEIEEKKSNIAFAQILPYADNMYEFGLDKEVIFEIISPIIIQYKMNKESIETIKAIINKK